jgi:hypothetical protein
LCQPRRHKASIRKRFLNTTYAQRITSQNSNFSPKAKTSFRKAKSRELQKTANLNTFFQIKVRALQKRTLKRRRKFQKSLQKRKQKTTEFPTISTRILSELQKNALKSSLSLKTQYYMIKFKDFTAN